MMVHCSGRTILESRYRAAQALEIIFRGKSSHAVSYPEKGINALDALIHFYNSLEAYKTTLRKDAQIPMIITDGGHRANINPDYARGELMDIIWTK